MYDYIIIGAGYGGVSAAALLAKSGFKVLILEAHTVVGGCASYFRRKDFLFDVGATTMSGVLSHQPMGRLFKELSIDPELKKIDPGMVIKLGSEEIIRYADKQKWINEAERAFGKGNHNEFWDKIYKIDRTAWEIIENNHRLPPRTFADFTDALKFTNIKGFKLVLPMLRNAAGILKKCGLHNNTKFLNFLKEQLLITSQNTIEDTPFLTAAMGLAYPSETYYPYGGMYRPAQMIVEKFQRFQGEILLREKAEKIIKFNDHYEVLTKKGGKFNAKGIISNIPIWNMQLITEGEISRYFGEISQLFDSAWGAFVTYFAIESRYELNSAYYQIHANEKIPYCSSDSIFVSFSLKDDRARAPEGWRAVTISVHTRVEYWDNIPPGEYETRKQMATESVLKLFDSAFPEMRESTKLFLLAGSPGTFEFFTRRFKGYVGGIPHSIRRSILKMPPNSTPFKNLYMVGDTVFPGQGTPAVVLGALNVHKRILSGN